MERPGLGIIIPAFNEELSIGNVIRNVSENGIVIVVNDCSTDRTSEVSEELGAIVINHSENKGYDVALNSGFEKAHEIGLTYVITIDADGQHDTGFVEEFCKLLYEENYEMVVGKRPSFARFSEWLMGVYFNYRFSIDDPLCGMKGYNMNIWVEYGKSFSKFSGIGTELLHFACLNKKRIKQVDVPIYKRSGTPRFGRIVQANLLILNALRKLIIK